MAEEGDEEVMRRQGLLCSNTSRWLFGFKRNPSLYGVGTFPKIDMEADLKLVADILYKKRVAPGHRKSDCLPNFDSQDLSNPAKTWF